MKTILAAWFLFVSAIFASAQSVIVYPTDDGTVYSTGFTSDSEPILANSAGSEGDIHFAAFNASADSSIELEINPCAEPLNGSLVFVFGLNNTSSALSASDYVAGTFLGAWNVAGLGAGQETFFNVTSFVQAVTSPYFGFGLQSTGADDFSSTAFNLGTPPELIVSTPEPSALALEVLGLASGVALNARPQSQGLQSRKCVNP